MQLADDVKLLDQNHVDQKKRALENAMKMNADNKKARLEEERVEA